MRVKFQVTLPSFQNLLRLNLEVGIVAVNNLDVFEAVFVGVVDCLNWTLSQLVVLGDIQIPSQGLLWRWGYGYPHSGLHLKMKGRREH